jgi:hypothetical protein
MVDEPKLGADGKPIEAPVVAPKWFEGKADAIVIGHLQNRGWADKPVEEVALAAIKAHQEAEKFIGAPADKLIRLPNDRADQEGWAAVYNKLGALKDGERPNFDGISADGKPLPKETQDLATMLAYRTRMNAENAIFAAQEIQKFLNADIKKAVEEFDAKLATQKDNLAKLWGPHYNGNKIVAENAMRALGVTPEDQTAAEKVVGYDRVMEMFRNIGSRIGEDKYVSGGNTGGGQQYRTSESIQARIAELKSDKAWVDRYLNGGTNSVEYKELQNLQRLLTAPVAA